jgi:aminoglycoside phosphotransferase (APT) family kinase protein
MELERLPDRGERHYLNHLRSAEDQLRSYLGSPVYIRVHDVVASLIRHLDATVGQWNLLSELAGRLPTTLVHGDIAPKNVQIRTDGNGFTVHPFDWETAGRGTPVADLEKIDMRTYYDVVHADWTDLSSDDVRQAAVVGRVFRLLAGLDWSCARLTYGWHPKAANQIELYDPRLATALRQLVGADVLRCTRC